jgi:predicted Zn-dependent protease
MSLYRFIERGAGRCLLLGVASALLALLMTNFGFAQAKGKGTAPKGDSDVAKKDDSRGTIEPFAPGTQSDPTRVDPATYLIGDAVDDADSPQYSDVGTAISRFASREANGLKEARDLLTEARTKHPELPPVEVLMAKLFITVQRVDLAANELEQAVRRSPKDPEPYLMFADRAILDRPPRVTDAEVLYQRADSLTREFKENNKRKQNFEKRVLNGLAFVAESRSQWSTAESLLRRLIAADPKNASAHQRLGGVLFQQATPGDNTKIGESYKSYATAVQHDPKAIKPYVALGRLFEQAALVARNANDNAKFKANRDRARDSFARATSGADADLSSILAAATWALQTSDLPLAKQYADLAMKKDVNSVDAKLVGALVARFAEDIPTAERYLNEAFLQAPGSFPVSNQLALVLIESPDKSKKDRALQLAEVNFRQYQQNAEAASTLGWIYYKLNRAAEAVRFLEAVANARALTPDSAYYVAVIFHDQGRHADAMAILQQALANPQPFANRQNAEDLMEKVRAAAQARAAEDSKGGSDSKSGSSTKGKSESTKASSKKATK